MSSYLWPKTTSSAEKGDTNEESTSADTIERVDATPVAEPVVESLPENTQSTQTETCEVNNDEFIGSIYICKISKEERLYIAEKLYDLLESYKMSLISEYRLSSEEERRLINEVEGKEIEKRLKGYEIALGGAELVDVYTNDEKERIKNDALRIKEKKDKDKKRKKQKKFARIFLFSFLFFFILNLLI